MPGKLHVAMPFSRVPPAMPPGPRTCIARSRSSQKRLTSPVAMPRTILASVRRLLSPRLPTPPSSGPSSLHSSASRRSSSLVVSRPLKRP